MNQILIISCLLLLMTVGVFPQTKSTVIDKTKFNGVWVFDAKASKADSETKKRYKGQDLNITYAEPELKIIEPRTRDSETRYATVVFFTDGRGETTKPYAFNQNAEFDSVTNWENNILVRRYVIPINYSSKQAGGIKYTEKYSLSEDGMTLTIITESKMDADATKLLLNKKPSTNEANVITRVYRKK